MKKVVLAEVAKSLFDVAWRSCAQFQLINRLAKRHFCMKHFEEIERLSTHGAKLETMDIDRRTSQLSGCLVRARRI
jgi:hypothetical protein